MKLTKEETSEVDSRLSICRSEAVVARRNVSLDQMTIDNKTETIIDRLAVRVTNEDVVNDYEKDERHREDTKRWSKVKCCREEKTEMTRRRRFVLDMTISRSFRHGLSLSLLLWTSSFLLLFLAQGVHSTNEDHPRYDRYSKYDQDSEVQGIPPEAQNTYNVIHFLRELIQRQQQQQQQQQQRANQQQLQMYNNGEDLSENQIDWRKVPLPLLYQIRAIINDGSKEEDKRGSYMSLCHFKICNLG